MPDRISRSARLQVSTHMMTGFSFTVFFQYTNHSFIVWFVLGISLFLTVSFSCIDLSNLQSSECSIGTLYISHYFVVICELACSLSTLPCTKIKWQALYVVWPTRHNYTYVVRYLTLQYVTEKKISSLKWLGQLSRKLSTHMMTGFSFTVFFQHTNHSFIVWFVSPGI